MTAGFLRVRFSSAPDPLYSQQWNEWVPLSRVRFLSRLTTFEQSTKASRYSCFSSYVILGLTVTIVFSPSTDVTARLWSVYSNGLSFTLWVRVSLPWLPASVVWTHSSQRMEMADVASWTMHDYVLHDDPSTMQQLSEHFFKVGYINGTNVSMTWVSVAEVYSGMNSSLCYGLASMPTMRHPPPARHSRIHSLGGRYIPVFATKV